MSRDKWGWKMKEEIVEIRDYTIAADSYLGYKQWAIDKAGPWLKSNLDVIDFWVDDGIESEVSGSDPQVSKHGQPNVCWIIKWASREAREAGFKAFGANPEWQAIWAEHPCPNAYLHMNVRFMRSATS